MDENNNEAVGRTLTFGEKAVGLSFNPGGNPKVDAIKKSCAEAIDLLNNERESIKAQEDDGQNGERLHMLSVAITELQTAQMWGVKAVTWGS